MSAVPFAADDTSIEQVIYTWSEVNRGGGRGLGFGAMSPRLKNYTPWLNIWPAERFTLTENALGRVELFHGWQDAITVGAFAIGDVNVVYRKIPDAGVDGVDRGRYVIHGLVGRREVLDLARVAPDSGVWLSADQCPLNSLPPLVALSPSELTPWSFEHGDAEDATSERLIRDLVQNDHELVLRDHSVEALDRLILAVHLAVPTSLWPDIELTSYLDRGGLTTRAAVRPRVSDGGLEESARVKQAGIAGCRLHEAVDQRWRAKRDSPWHGFLDWAASRASPKEVRDSVRTLDTVTLSPVEARRREVGLIIADACEMKAWNFTQALDDHGLVRVLARPAVGKVIGAWVADARPHELRAVFGEIEERASYARLKTVLDARVLTTKRLADAWQRSAAAPLGFVLLNRDTSRLKGAWAVPRVPSANHVADATRLAKQLTTSDPGLAACVDLFRGGVLHHREWRGVMIEALLASGAQPDFALYELLLRAGADDRILLESALDHLELFADWLKMPEEYREAFRRVLARPTLLSRILGLVHQ